MELDLNSGWGSDDDARVLDPYAGSRYVPRPPRMYERRADTAPLEPASSLSTPPSTPPHTQTAYEPAAVTITADLDDLWSDDEQPAPVPLQFQAGLPDVEVLETQRELDAWREMITAAVDDNTQTIILS